jgi:NADH-quinone oxidoreductase subunit N
VSLAGVLGTLGILAVRLERGVSAYRMYTFNAMMVQDQISVFFRILFLLGAAATMLFSMRSRETEDYRQGEYYALLLGALMGAMFLVGADSFLVFILGFETLSICSYILAGFIKHERQSAEAALKYLIYGAVTSGVMLFGISYVYGMTGTLSIGRGIADLAAQLAGGRLPHLAWFLVLTLMLAGIGFKMAMVPFHFWCPDVYQGAPTPITAFLSVVSKAAGFGALLRVMLPFFAAGNVVVAFHTNYLCLIELPIFFGVLSIVTMTFGNLVALRQTDVKRLLAYSSIAHAGYLLMGMTVYERSSIEAMLFYFFVYLFMNLGAFWVVIVLINRLGGAEIERFRGAAFKAPFLFVAMFIFLISLTGLPPTAGFVGKFMLFKVVIGAGLSHMSSSGALTPMAVFYFVVALIGFLNSVISLYYYMTIARAMALEKPVDDLPLGDDAMDRAYAALFLAPTILLLYFAPVLQLIQLTAR